MVSPMGGLCMLVGHYEMLLNSLAVEPDRIAERQRERSCF
jgi:hypothetical protein